jgi:hypothetical protein
MQNTQPHSFDSDGYSPSPAADLASPSSRDSLRREVHLRRASLTRQEYGFLTGLMQDGNEQEILVAKRRLADTSLFFEYQTKNGAAAAGAPDTTTAQDGGEQQQQEEEAPLPPTLTAVASEGSTKRQEFLDERRKSQLHASMWRAHQNGLALSQKSSRESFVRREQSWTANKFSAVVETGHKKAGRDSLLSKMELLEIKEKTRPSFHRQLSQPRILHQQTGIFHQSFTNLQFDSKEMSPPAATPHFPRRQRRASISGPFITTPPLGPRPRKLNLDQTIIDTKLAPPAVQPLSRIQSGPAAEASGPPPPLQRMGSTGSHGKPPPALRRRGSASGHVQHPYPHPTSLQRRGSTGGFPPTPMAPPLPRRGSSGGFSPNQVTPPIMRRLSSRGSTVRRMSSSNLDGIPEEVQRSKKEKKDASWEGSMLSEEMEDKKMSDEEESAKQQRQEEELPSWQSGLSFRRASVSSYEGEGMEISAFLDDVDMTEHDVEEDELYEEEEPTEEMSQLSTYDEEDEGLHLQSFTDDQSELSTAPTTRRRRLSNGSAAHVPMIMRRASLNVYGGEGMEISDWDAQEHMEMRRATMENYRGTNHHSHTNSFVGLPFGDYVVVQANTIVASASFDETKSVARQTSLLERHVQRIPRSFSEDELSSLLVARKNSKYDQGVVVLTSEKCVFS